MTSVIKIPDEDLAEAARLESQAERTDDAQEAAGLRIVINFLRTLPDYPVLDDPRTEENEDLGRVVLEEFGVITPYTPEDDWWKTMPVRLAYGCVGGLQVEVGPYTLGKRELRVLSRAINTWLEQENQSRRIQAERETAERADANQDGQAHDALVVDLDAKRNKTTRCRP